MLHVTNIITSNKERRREDDDEKKKTFCQIKVSVWGIITDNNLQKSQ